jgi:hypothetical protein
LSEISRRDSPRRGFRLNIWLAFSSTSYMDTRELEKITYMKFTCLTADDLHSVIIDKYNSIQKLYFSLANFHFRLKPFLFLPHIPLRLKQEGCGQFFGTMRFRPKISMRIRIQSANQNAASRGSGSRTLYNKVLAKLSMTLPIFFIKDPGSRSQFRIRIRESNFMRIQIPSTDCRYHV